MKTDVKGCSTCQIGTEQYEPYHSPVSCIFHGMKDNCNCKEGTRIQYDYRHSNGKLFSSDANTLKNCRKERDEWIKNQSLSQPIIPNPLN